MKENKILFIDNTIKFYESNQYIKVIKEHNAFYYIVHCYNLNNQYTGAKYVKESELLNIWEHMTGQKYDYIFLCN